MICWKLHIQYIADGADIYLNKCYPMVNAQTTPAPEMAWHSRPSKITGLSAAQLRRAVQAGLLPPPTKAGLRLRGWRVSDLQKLITPPSA